MPTRLEVDIKIRIVKEDGHPEQGGIQGAIDIYLILGENNNIEQIYNMISEYKEFISQLNMKKGVADHNFITANEEETEVTEIFTKEFFNELSASRPFFAEITEIKKSGINYTETNAHAAASCALKEIAAMKIKKHCVKLIIKPVYYMNNSISDIAIWASRGDSPPNAECSEEAGKALEGIPNMTYRCPLLNECWLNMSRVISVIM